MNQKGSVIICDTREQKNKHITDYFDEHGIRWIRSKMFVGDYSLVDNMTVYIDKKKDLQEVYSNLVQQHDRFRDECLRAREYDIDLVLLVERNRIQSVEDVHTWSNPRYFQYQALLKRGERPRYKPPISSEQLQKIIERMAYSYGIRWEFCKKQDTGRKIMEILEVNTDDMEVKHE